MAIDKIWEEVHSTRTWGAYPSEPVIRFVARNYYNSDDRSKVKILDFGCGGGSHTWYLAREGFATYAFDGSKSAVKNVHNRLNQDNLSADLKVLDGVDVAQNYDELFFDAIIDNVSSCANCITDIQRMYAGMYKILKHGGKLFTSVFERKTTGYGIGTKIEENTFTDIPEGHLSGIGVQHFYDEKEITDILINAGFVNIQINPFYFEDRGCIVSEYIIHAEKQ